MPCTTVLKPRGEVDASAITAYQLRRRAWAAVDLEFYARPGNFADALEEARSKNLGANNLQQVSRRVECRIPVSGAQPRIPRPLDHRTGGIVFSGFESSRCGSG